MTKHTVATRFRRVITLHVAKNLLASHDYQPPLLLGIHGPSGDGKTYQAALVLRELGVETVFISGGELESDHAGQPARLIRERYKEASASSEVNGHAALVINDFDTGVGSWGDRVQYTANRQLVFAELMHLVDEPLMVGGAQTRRVPIIITGNDFTRLHRPLTRPGRMTSFEWVPTTEERAKIVEGIFPELSLGDCTRFVEAFSRRREVQPVAFFSTIRSVLTDEVLWNRIEGLSPDLRLKSVGGLIGTSILTRLTVEECIAAGKRLLAEGLLVSHLPGENS